MRQAIDELIESSRPLPAVILKLLVLRSLLFCAIRTKTLPAEDRSPTRRLEGYGVSLSALVAGNLESFTLSTWSSRATKISTARIPARLTPLWVGQVPFLIVFLLALSERKRGCTFRACNLKIWHGALFSMRARPTCLPSLLFGALPSK